MIPRRREVQRHAGALALIAATAATAARAQVGIPVYGYDIVHVYPHDAQAFTEGLFYLDGALYESTGLNGQSFIRRERLDTGRVLQQIRIPEQYFGEGIVSWHHELISLTWKSQTGFVYDLATFRRLRVFHYPGEGWALTSDGTHLIMSDGTSQLRVLDPATLDEIRRIDVTLEGKPVRNLNELEWVDGEIYANLWQTDWIVRIDPPTGQVIGVIDLRGLLPDAERIAGHTDVLNGIAYDAVGHRLFVTGKNWPKLFEIRLHLVGRLNAQP